MSGKFIFSLSNKMIGKGRKILKPLLSLFLVSFFIFTSCIIDCDEPDTSFQSTENSTSSSSSITSSSELPVSNEAIPQKAILKIGFADDNSARTVLPKVQLSNYVLKGSLAGGASVVLATADTKEVMKTKEIELDPGVWSFTLSADMTGTSVLSSVKSYSDTQAVTLTGNPVTVNFDLKPRDSNGTEITKGAVSISLTLSSDVISANKARASLKLGGVEKAAKEDDVSAGGTFTFTAENLDKDTYDLEIEFYSKDVDSGTIIPQNTWQALVRIEPGLLSSAEVTGFNLNEVYNITYENVGDAVPDPVAASGIAIKSFSRKSASFELPKYKKSGYYFAGWYDNAAFEGSSITEFNPANESSSVTLYAKWVSTTIFVKQGATGSGDSLDNAVCNFSAAFDVMKEIKTLSETANDFIIKVCGQVDGNQSLPTGLTDAIATSVTIEGNTGLDAAGVPQDSLDGNNSGTVLSISTNVPVVIKDLTITGGNTAKGGGIYMASGSNVTLESGAVIGKDVQTIAGADASEPGNTASTYGGGIYIVEGTLILKNGSKVCNNYLNSTNVTSGGAGIALMGGSLTIENGAAISWNKSAARGGGIMVPYEGTAASVITMKGGEISHNAAGRYGGGVVIGHTGGTYSAKTFNFSGGTISENNVTGTGSSPTRGGGGIFFDGGTFTMSGNAVIEKNTVAGAGGGISISASGQASGTFTMTGGIIRNNSAGTGGAIYFNDNEDGNYENSYTISGSATIPYGVDNVKGSGKNDVYTGKSSSLEIAAALGSSFPDVGITAGEWKRGKAVVKADSDLTSYKDNFVLTSADWNVKLSPDNKQLLLDSPIYVAGNNYKVCTTPGSYSAETTGKKSAPFDTIGHATSLLSDSNCHYTILVDGELNGAQTLPSSGIAAASITLKGARGNTSDKINGTNGTESGTSLTISLPETIPVYIENLTITGGNAVNGGGINIGENAVVFLGNDLIVSGNKASGHGGGVYAPNGVNVSGNVEITGNTDSASTPKPSNLYLPAGKCVNVNGALTKGSERAKIGISTADEPSLTSRIAFTLNYGSYNSDTAPGTYFTGDKWNVAWGSGTAAGEAVLAASGGQLIIEPIYEDITISADKTSFEKDAASKIITFSAKGKDSEGHEQEISIRSDDGQVEITSFTVTCHGETVPESYYEKDENEGTLTLGNSLPLGNYVVSVIAKYNDRTYSASFAIAIEKYAALPSSYSDIESGKTYAVADSSAMEKLAEFSSDGYTFSDVTLILSSNITIDSAWTPIGNGTAFCGTFDGDGNTVTFASGTNAEAFFGNVNGSVKNLKVAGSTSVAGIAKYANSSAVIENCENLATVTGSTTQEYCAGIVADVANATIKGCVNTGTITSNVVLPADNYSYGAGGITGRVSDGGIVDSCINTGSVTGPNAGGITGEVDSRSTIRNAYNSGNVTSTENYAGGIVGAAIGNGGDIDQACHIDNCFNSGSVTVTGTTYVGYAGGIAGRLGWGNVGWAQNCLNIGNVSKDLGVPSGSCAGALFGLKDGWSRIDFCYYKDGCAGSGFGTGESSIDTENECIKAAQSGSNNAVISAAVTLNGTDYAADTSTVLSLLNAWVRANNTDGVYFEWKEGENHWPKLKSE